MGSPEDKLYIPKGQVQQSKENGQPIIHVGIQYRLGSTFARVSSQWGSQRGREEWLTGDSLWVRGEQVAVGC